MRFRSTVLVLELTRHNPKLSVHYFTDFKRNDTFLHLNNDFERSLAKTSDLLCFQIYF